MEIQEVLVIRNIFFVEGLIHHSIIPQNIIVIKKLFLPI